LATVLAFDDFNAIFYISDGCSEASSGLELGYKNNFLISYILDWSEQLGYKTIF
jgi:hypothetical protein